MNTKHEHELVEPFQNLSDEINFKRNTKDNLSFLDYERRINELDRKALNKEIKINEEFFKPSNLNDLTLNDICKLNIDEYKLFCSNPQLASKIREEMIPSLLKWQVYSFVDSLDRKKTKRELTFNPSHLCLSKDCSKLLIAGENKLVFKDVWTGLITLHPLKLESKILCVALSYFNSLISIAFQESYIEIYDVLYGNVKHSFTNILAENMKFSNKNSYLAVKTKNGTKIVIYSLITNNIVSIFSYDFKINDYNFTIKDDKIALAVDSFYNLIFFDIITKNQTQVNYLDQIYLFTFSNDEKYALFLSLDKKIMVWNLKDNKKIISSAQDHQSSNIKNLIFSSDDCYFAYSCDEILFVWNFHERMRILKLKPHDDNIECVKFLSNEKIVSISSSKMIVIIDFKTGKFISKPNFDYPSINYENQNIKSVSNNGALMAITNKENNRISIWETERMNLVDFNNEKLSFKIKLLKFSLNGKYLAVILDNNVIEIWNANNLKTNSIFEFKGHTDEILTVDFNNDNILISGGKDRKIIFWDVNNQNKLEELKKQDSSITALKFFYKGNYFISGAEDGLLCIWETISRKLVISSIISIPSPINCICLYDIEEVEDFYYFIVSSDEGLFYFEFSKGSKQFPLALKESNQRKTKLNIKSLLFNEKNNIFFGTGLSSNEKDSALLGSFNLKDKSCLLYTVNMKEIIHIKKEEKGILKLYGQDSIKDYAPENTKKECFLIKNAVSVSKNSNFISSIDDGILKCHKIDTKEDFLFEFPNINKDKLTFLCFSNDSNRFLIGGSPLSDFFEYEIIKKEKKMAFRGHSNHVKCAEYSYDGLKIVSGGSDKKVIIWDVLTGNKLFEPFINHLEDITCVTFSLDGKKIASAGEDLSIYINEINDDFKSQTYKIENALANIINELKFDKKGSILYASSTLDYYIKRFELDGLKTGKPKKSFEYGYFGDSFCFSENMEDIFINTVKMNEKNQKINEITLLKPNIKNYIVFLSKLKGRNFKKIIISKEDFFIIKKSSVICYRDFYSNEYIFSTPAQSLSNIYSLSTPLENLKLEDIELCCSGQEIFRLYPFNYTFLQIIAYLGDLKTFENFTNYLKSKNKFIEFYAFVEKDIHNKSALEIVLLNENKELLSAFLSYFFENYNFSHNDRLLQSCGIEFFNNDFLVSIADLWGNDTYLISEILKMGFQDNCEINEISYSGFKEPFMILKKNENLLSEKMIISIIESEQNKKFNDSEKITEKINIKRFYFNNLLKIDQSSKKLFKKLALLESDNPLFGNEVYIKLLEYKWNSYGKKEFFKDFLNFFIFMLIYLVNVLFVFPTRIETYEWEFYKYKNVNISFQEINYYTFSFFLDFIIFCFLIHHIYEEVKQIILVESDYYFRNLWNWIDILLIFFIIPTLILDIMNILELYNHFDILKILHSGAIFLFFLRFSSFSRGLDGTAFMIRAIIRSFVDIRYFLAFMMVFIFGFSFAGYIIQKEYNFEYDSAINVFMRQMVGDLSKLDDLEEQVYFIKWLIFIIAAFMLTIILMNLLIAIINGSLSAVSNSENLTRIYERTNIMYEIDVGIQESSSLEDNFLYYFSAVGFQQKNNSDLEEIKESIAEIENKMEKLNELENENKDRLSLANDKIVSLLKKL